MERDVAIFIIGLLVGYAVGTLVFLPIIKHYKDDSK